MSEFCVPVARVRAIEPIEGADLIELAVVGEYRSVVQKGKFTAGQDAIYIPEGSVVPDELLEKMGLIGKLSGSKKNRVKAIRLRGALSQGLVLDFGTAGLADNKQDFYAENDNVAEFLGIVKYEPPIPTSMRGEVFHIDCFSVPGGAPKYDIENFKWFANAFEEGEHVVMTEKVHGTFCCFSIAAGMDHPEAFNGNGMVMSKGLGSKGLVFKNNERNVGNIYVMAAKRLDIHARLNAVYPDHTVHLMGEVYGSGVQDLTYDMKDGERGFAAFDICVDGRYLNDDEKEVAFARLDVPRVPVLYRGPFTRPMMELCTNGKTVIGNFAHVQEGCVITPCVERRVDRLGRLILKSVSGDYLTRKNATEFN